MGLGFGLSPFEFKRDLSHRGIEKPHESKEFNQLLPGIRFFNPVVLPACMNEGVLLGVPAALGSVDDFSKM